MGGQCGRRATREAKRLETAADQNAISQVNPTREAKRLETAADQNAISQVNLLQAMRI